MSDDRRSFGRNDSRVHHSSTRSPSSGPYWRPDHNAPPRGYETNQDRRSVRPSFPDPKQIIPTSSHRPTSRHEPTGSGNVVSGSTRGDDSARSFQNRPIRDRPIGNPELLQTRPKNCLTKKANDGTPISLQANYFKIMTATDWCLYKYHVDFSPEEDQTITRKGMLKPHASTIGGYIFDGTVLYTSHRLPQPLKIQTTRKADGASIQITLRYVGDIVKGDECYIQFYNIIMRKCQEYLQLQLVGRNYYDARSKVEVPQFGLELWPGLVTSIRQYENEILMCSEITYKVMRQQTVLDILRECYNRYGGNNYQARFNAQVIGSTVLTAYNNNTYRIEDVEYTVSPESTFSGKNGDVTYKDYYLNKYQINIRDLRQPLLLSRSRARDRRAGMSELVYLVPELCNTTGLTDEMRGNHNMMRELANHTRINPRNRIERLMSFNRRLHSEPKVVKELGDWNLKLNTQLVTVPARKLEPEDIWFGNAKVSAGHQADWTQQLRNNRLFIAAKLQDWFVIVPSRLMKDAHSFIDTMRSSVRQMQFEIAAPQFHSINDDHAHSYVAAIEEIMRRANPQMIMSIMTNNRADRYAAIKKKCCIDRPVPSQCILGKNLNGRGVASIATKVAIQLNCKLGGTPWIAQVNSKTLMVVGFDVCHDTSNKSNSYGALVASLDQTYGRYFSAVSAHTSDEELSNNLAASMERALNQYKHFNKKLPDRIVVYRDGVGDGQIPYVHEHEVVNLKRKLVELYGREDLVKLAYILVTKRLNTRLFYNQNNPPPGTIVDDVITNPAKYDFYIVSQSVRQGTVSPTGYNVIYDTCQYSPSILQRLSYKLTHMYFNWSGTVRVPAPCQFAHKLAFFVSQSLHSIPSSHLENILYYL